jgi:hypothetical protein
MKKEALKRIFDFLEEEEGKNTPFIWKHINGEPLTEDDLNIKGHLLLPYSKIQSLPNDLKVKGDLELWYSTIEVLPKGLEVDGSLTLEGSKIKSLPKD